MKKVYKPRFSARKKNRDHMMLLLSMDTFQKEVAEFRDYIGIKPKGNKSDEQEKWLASIAWQINEYVRAVNTLIRSYQLPEHYHRHVRDYIETGLVSWPVNNFTVIPAGYAEQAAVVKVSTDLTQDEAEDVSAELKHLGGGLPSYGTIKNLDEMLKSEELYKVRDEFNQNDRREYVLTVKEQDKWGADQHYEHKRTLDEQRMKRFGKK